jgi:hypothetical protein
MGPGRLRKRHPLFPPWSHRDLGPGRLRGPGRDLAPGRSPRGLGPEPLSQAPGDHCLDQTRVPTVSGESCSDVRPSLALEERESGNDIFAALYAINKTLNQKGTTYWIGSGERTGSGSGSGPGDGDADSGVLVSNSIASSMPSVLTMISEAISSLE